MSKELDELEKIKNRYDNLEIRLTYWYIKRTNPPSLDFNIIKQALQRLESIDNANPSEALECLEENELVLLRKDYNLLHQALIKAQEQEKVLEIIKEKNVDIIRIRHLIFKSQKNPKYWDLRYYNEFRVIDDEKLTQEEFELLKRYFNG